MGANSRAYRRAWATCCVVSQHRIDLPGDRTDMMAMRERPEFARTVRKIWTELDIR